MPYALLGLVAALTIVVGNWAAVTQENSKRLLAYSSISNAGYLLLGIIANNAYGNIGLIIYLLVYTLMNMGAFGIVISLRRRGIIGDNVDDMAGLAQKAPGMAAMMSIFMLSLAGLPPLAGFFGKFYLFSAAFRAGPNHGLLWLVALALFGSLISLYYYLIVLKVIFQTQGIETCSRSSLAQNGLSRLTIVFAAAIVLFLGMVPQFLVARILVVLQ